MTNPLMEIIASGEGDYNSYNRGTYKNNLGKHVIIPANKAIDFSQITIGEIQRRQKLPKSDPNSLFAVGRYQFIPRTLGAGIKKLQLDDSERFTSELQDRLFNEYLIPEKRPEIKAYIIGKPGATLHDAQKATCQEWASVEDPDTPGHAFSFYEKHGNKMSTTATQIASALDEMRTEYKAHIDKGISADEAWRAAMTMGAGQFHHIVKPHTVRHHSTSILSEGAYNPAVGELQTRLRELGYTDAQGHPLTIDHHFGRNTRHAVEAFQRHHALSTDGRAGPNTWAVLREATPSISPSLAPTAPPAAVFESLAFPQIAPPNVDPTAIRTLQQQLNMLSMADHRNPSLPLTGTYDDANRFAVTEFQRTQGIPSTGVADPATRGLIEARATIATLKQSATLYAPATHDTSLLEKLADTTQDQSSAPDEVGPPHHIAHASHLAHREGSPPATSLTLSEPVASRLHHDALPDQNPWAAMQAQLHDMQRQVEAMHRQREQEREKERAQEGSRAMPNEPAHHSTYEAQRHETWPPYAAEPLSYSNPDHPQHALYAKLKELLPSGTTEERLEQSTAACYMGRITRPEQLHQIHIRDDAVHFLTTRPDAYASINLDQPVPTVQQTMQQVQLHDQQQAQTRAQFEVQQRESNARGGPTLRGPAC